MDYVDDVPHNQRQDESWRTFYESAWRARYEFISDLIEKGETDPIRCLNILRARERKFDLLIDEDSWKPVWERRAPDRRKCLPSGVESARTASFFNTITSVPAYTESAGMDFIIDFIEERGTPDAILELGSGIGRNFIELHSRGLSRDCPMFGGELTSSGVSLARRLVALNKDIKAAFFGFDHTAPNLDAFKAHGFKNVLAYTCHSIEQVNYVPIEFFKVVSAAAENVTCIHMEPFSFQLGAEAAVNRELLKAFAERNWNLNLVQAAAAAEKQGIIFREWISQGNFISSDGFNQTSIMIWKNARR